MRTDQRRDQFRKMWAELAEDPDAYFEYYRMPVGWTRASLTHGPALCANPNDWRVVHPKRGAPEPRYATASDLAALWKEVDETGGALEFHINSQWVRPSALGPRIGTDLNRWRVVPKDLPVEFWVNLYEENGRTWHGSLFVTEQQAREAADKAKAACRTMRLVEEKQ